MKGILFLILISFTLCESIFDYTIKCDDNLYEAKVPAIKHSTDKTLSKYELFVKGSCKGNISDGPVYQCLDHSDDQNKDSKKKLRKVGQSCKIDEDCYDEKQKTYLECKGKKCEDKCGNKCTESQDCLLKKNSLTDYDCFDYLKEGDECIENKGGCAPGYECKNYDDATKYKCVKMYSLDDGKEVYTTNYGENNICKSGLSFTKDSKYYCVSIKEEGGCKDIGGGAYGSEITLSNDEKIQINCHKIIDNWVPEYSKSRITYFKDKVVDAFNKIKLDKLAKKRKALTTDKKYKEKLIIYNNWVGLIGQKIINEKGEAESGKKKCLQFVVNEQSSSTLKMSIALALFALIL